MLFRLSFKNQEGLWRFINLEGFMMHYPTYKLHCLNLHGFYRNVLVLSFKTRKVSENFYKFKVLTQNLPGWLTSHACAVFIFKSVCFDFFWLYPIEYLISRIVFASSIKTLQWEMKKFYTAGYLFLLD